MLFNLARFTFDARRAFLHVPEKEYVIVTPPAEWIEMRAEAGLDVAVCWRMLKTLYGRRVAAQAWTDFLANILQTECAMEQYKPIPIFFKSTKPGSHMSLEVHMDDGHGIGTEAEIERFIRIIGSKTSIKWTGPHRHSHNPVYTHLTVSGS